MRPSSTISEKTIPTFKKFLSEKKSRPLDEKWLTDLDPNQGDRKVLKAAPIFINPSRKEWSEASGRGDIGGVRCLITKSGDLFIWSAIAAIHAGALPVIKKERPDTKIENEGYGTKDYRIGFYEPGDRRPVITNALKKFPYLKQVPLNDVFKNP